MLGCCSCMVPPNEVDAQVHRYAVQAITIEYIVLLSVSLGLVCSLGKSCSLGAACLQPGIERPASKWRGRCAVRPRVDSRRSSLGALGIVPCACVSWCLCRYLWLFRGVLTLQSAPSHGQH